MQWRKSERSSAYNGCVEVARDGDRMLVRDSKDPEGPVLAVTLVQWRAFLESLRG